MTSMKNQVALVTGGGGGIGSAICQKLAAEGATLIIPYRSNTEKAEATRASLAGSGHLIKKVSVTDSDSLKTFAAEVTEQFGRLDLLVNNAGITTPVPHDNLDDLTDEWIDAIFATNFRGAFATVRAFNSLLQQDDGGTIINLSSVAGTTGVGSNVAYCASKAAMDSMTRSLARALAPKVRVLSVAPGWVLGEYAKSFPQEYLDAQANAAPMQKLASPEDVATTVWAAHMALPMATGVIIPVDGGRPLGA